MKSKKIAKKRPKKTLPKPPGIAKSISDMDKLKAIARAMLARLEEVLASPNDDGQKSYEWLFGTKQPLITTLATLAELVLKLAGLQEQGAAEDTGLPLSEADIALVQNFLEKAK